MSLSLSTKCLDCLSGTQGCTRTQAWVGRHPHTGDSSGKVRSVLSFAWLPHTSAECQLSYSFVLGGGRGMMRGTKTPNNKKGPQQCCYLRRIYCLPSRFFFFSLSLCAPLSTFTLARRISLSSALESSSVSTHAEVHSEKT